MSTLAIFLRQVRSRSREHQRSMRLLSGERLAGQMVAVLRQELDSMIRAIYLLAQGLERRELLIDASVRGEKWSQEGSRAMVTDREMVELAQTLQGWTQSVYKFGCAFIHLSGLHDYNDRDPLAQLPAEERNDILIHCRHYHGGPGPGAERFSDLVPYLPRVLEKISGNLECYLAALERGEVRSANEVKLTLGVAAASQKENSNESYRCYRHLGLNTRRLCQRDRCRIGRAEHLHGDCRGGVGKFFKWQAGVQSTGASCSVL